MIGPSNTQAKSRSRGQASTGRGSKSINDDRLTDQLACQIMRWKVAPGRFLTGDRGWMPRWRFQPLTNVEDALKLVNTAGATLVLTISADGSCAAAATKAERTGRASCASVATSITVAISRAIGLEVSDGVAPSASGKSVRRTSEGQPQ
jgi:hypothetical protein